MSFDRNEEWIREKKTIRKVRTLLVGIVEHRVIAQSEAAELSLVCQEECSKIAEPSVRTMSE